MNTKNPKLTTLSFGGGQDSTALLLKIIFDADFRKTYAPNDFVAIMADTGNEHPATYKHTVAIMRLAKKHGVDFLFLTSSLDRSAAEMGITAGELKDLGGREGYHSESWSDYVGHYKRVREVPMLLGKKSCTGNLKISPLHRFLEQYVAAKYAFKAEKVSGGRCSGKKAIPAFAKKFCRIVTMIGIAKGEEKRAKGDDKGRAASFAAYHIKLAKAKAEGKKLPNPPRIAKWELESIETIYPLIDIGFGRKECQDYIAGRKVETSIPVPPPSNCMFCPYMSLVELLWLKRNHPAKLDQWIALEAAKIAKTEERNIEKIAAGKKPSGNNGAMKGGLLPAQVAAAEKTLGHMTNLELDDYKMSHGHCVASIY